METAYAQTITIFSKGIIHKLKLKVSEVVNDRLDFILFYFLIFLYFRLKQKI